MVNKDQLDLTPEGKEVLALMARHFTAEQFQPALTLIEQRYTEDQTVWDADLNSDSKLPFLKTNPAHRLLVFFASPRHLAQIKSELEQRAAETANQPAAAPSRKSSAATKPKATRKAHRKTSGRKRAVSKTIRQKPRKSRRSQPMMKRPKRKSSPAKAKKSRAKKR